MLKSLIGFFAGSAVTAFAILVVIGLAEPPEEPATKRSLIFETAESISSAEASVIRAEPQSQPDDSQPIVPAQPADIFGVTANPQTVADLVALSEKADAADIAWREAENEFHTALAAVPIENPVVLPSEFAWLTEKPSIPHAFFQREPVDQDWAPAMEANIQGYIYKNPEAIGTYGHPTVRCRSTRCEVQFVAYNTEQSSIASSSFWARFSARMSSETWAEQFLSGARFGNPMNYYIDMNMEGDVTTIMLHLWTSAE